MNYLKLNKNQTLYFTAKEGATIDQVLDEARLLIACINSMVVVDINGFEMHIDAETDYQDLKVDYLYWMDRISDAGMKGAEAGRKLMKIGASCEDIEEFTRILKEASNNFRMPLSGVNFKRNQIPPVEFGYIQSGNSTLIKLAEKDNENLMAVGSRAFFKEFNPNKI